MERRTLAALIVAAVVVSAMLAWLTLSRARIWQARSVATPVVSEVRNVAAFHKISVSGAADVTLVQGTAPSVKVESASNLPVTTRVENDTLTIRTDGNLRDWWRLFNRAQRPAARLTITFTELSDVDFSGAVKVRSAGIRSPSLHVDVSGAGSLDLDNLRTDELFVEGAGTVKASVAGRAAHQRIEISGAGSYQAAELASETAIVDVSGAGNVVVNATNTLRINISGAGAVAYIGNPTVQKTISGMGRVRQLTGRSEVRAGDGPRDTLPGEPRRRNAMPIA